MIKINKKYMYILYFLLLIFLFIYISILNKNLNKLKEYNILEEQIIMDLEGYTFDKNEFKYTYDDENIVINEIQFIKIIDIKKDKNSLLDLNVFVKFKDKKYDHESVVYFDIIYLNKNNKFILESLSINSIYHIIPHMENIRFAE